MTARVAHIATVDMTPGILLRGQLRAQRDAGFDVTTISAPGPYVPGLEAEGIRHVPWRHATRDWNLREDARAFVELHSILGRERFDIVHTHTPKAGLFGRVSARLRHVPVVVNTVHGFLATADDPLHRRGLYMGCEWFAARFSDLELYQSEADLRRARKLRIVGRSKSVPIGNGTDLRRFDPTALNGDVSGLRRHLGIPESSFVVGTIGRIVVEKGYREFFSAARSIRAETPDVRFLVVGDVVPSRPDPIGESELEAARRDVIITGWRDDVPELLSLMDVFVLASWREGFPRSAIEAAAMGKPLVLSDIPGCHEVARDGVEAVFVPPKDAVALTAAIRSLIADPDRVDAMGRSARSRALDRFDEERVARVTIDHYEDLLGRSRAAR